MKAATKITNAKLLFEQLGWQSKAKQSKRSAKIPNGKSSDS
jgi:hypothetical protein